MSRSFRLRDERPVQLLEVKLHVRNDGLSLARFLERDSVDEIDIDDGAAAKVGFEHTKNFFEHLMIEAQSTDHTQINLPWSVLDNPVLLNHMAIVLEDVSEERAGDIVSIAADDNRLDAP